MTRDDIIQMARKAGMSGLSLIDIGYLERFHALAIAAAKEEMLTAGNDQRLEEARAAEREACAELCDDRDDRPPQPAQQPLTSARIDELIQEGVFGCNPYELVRRLEEERGVFKTRPLTDEQIDEMWQQSCREYFSGLQREIHLARSVEAAHGIK